MTESSVPDKQAGTWRVTGLPPGLDYDPDTGEIYGTPTEPGTYPITVTFWGDNPEDQMQQWATSIDIREEK